MWVGCGQLAEEDSWLLDLMYIWLVIMKNVVILAPECCLRVTLCCLRP